GSAEQDSARAIVERLGGRVEQMLGDAVVAIFGVPTVREDDAGRALDAAEELGDEIGARVGLVTGEVFVGRDGPVSGEPLAAAEELARAAAPGEVAISETARLLAETRGLRLDSPLVGRTRQLAALAEAHTSSREDCTCQLFTVLGAAGVGKSRLLEEFLGELGKTTVMRELDALPGGPVVLAVEDLHAADTELLDEVERLAERSRGVPLLMVWTPRREPPDERPGWGGGRVNPRTLLLEPLSEEEAEQLMDNLLGESELPPIVRSYIVRAAEGNPLFLEEFLASLIDRDV